MISDREMSGIVRAWLRRDEPESAERVLEEVLSQLDTTPQRRPLRPARIRGLTASTELALVAAAVVVVALVGVELATRIGATLGGPVGSPPSGPTAAATSPAPSSSDAPDHGRIEPGTYELGWPLGPVDARVRVTVPSGWAWIGSPATTIYKDRGRLFGFPVDLGVHAVSRVVTSVCATDASAGDAGPQFVEVGPTVDELVAALAGIDGVRWTGPTDVAVGGHPAKLLQVTWSATECEGPTRRWLWLGDAGAFFVEDGVSASVYVLDVDGDRLVITTEVRGPRARDVAELAGVLDSLEIERDPGTGDRATRAPAPESSASGRFPVSAGPDGDLRLGRHTAIVDGVRFSFAVSSRGWEAQRSFTINKSFTGPQGAEAILRWTAFPDSVHVDPCPQVVDPAAPVTAADLAAALAAAPGVEPIDGPAEVRVGGLPAMHVVVRVQEDLGCDPGYFYAYEPVMGGALWTETREGGTILVWVLEVDDVLLLIEAQMTAEARSAVRAEILEVVDSIRFEPAP